MKPAAVKELIGHGSPPNIGVFENFGMKGVRRPDHSLMCVNSCGRRQINESMTKL